MTTPKAFTSVPPLYQVRNVSVYDDEVTIGSSMAASPNALSLEDDLQTIFTLLNLHINGSVASNDFYQTTIAPTTFENGVVRGINDNNQAVHDLERQRILKFLSIVGVDIALSVAATGTLTSTGVDVSNLDTVTIDTKTYTFQTTLTNVDGNVQIGGTAAASLANLAAAINLTGTPGTDYALATTIHPTVFAEAVTATTITATAKDQGTGGNSIVTTEAAVTLSWGAGTLAGGGGTVDVVVLAPDQLPTTSTTAAIGTVTTLGIVGATATTFGTASDTDFVPGANGVSAKSQCILTDSTTGEPITRISDNKQVYGYFQYQSSTDGSTFTGTSPNGVQMSLVVIDSTGAAMELISTGDLPATTTVNYACVIRDAFQDCPEEAWLSSGFVEGGAAVTALEQAYAQQGATPFTTTTDAELNLGTGFKWQINDDGGTGNPLFTVTEGSTGSTSDVAVNADTDTFTVAAAASNFTNGVTIDTSDPIDIGVTATDQITFSGAATVTTTSGTMTVTNDSANTVISTTTSGGIIASSAGIVDIDGTNITADATGTMSLDSADTTNLTMTASDAGVKSLTISSNNAGAGTSTLDMDGDAVNIVANVTDVDVSAGTSVDIAAGTEVTIASGGTSDVDISAARDIDMAADCILFDPSNQSTGHEHWRSDFHYFGDTNRGNGYVTMNAQDASGSATTGGVTVVRLMGTVTGSTIVSSTAAVPSLTDANFVTSGITGLAAGSIIAVVGAVPQCLNGFYEVQDGSTTTLTLRGVGANALGSGNTVTKQDVDTVAAVTSGTIYTATLCVIRCSTAGSWESADFSATPVTYTAFASSTQTLDDVYSNNSVVDVNSADGVPTWANDNNSDTTAVSEFSKEPTASTAGVIVDIIAGSNTTGTNLNVTNNGTGDSIVVADAAGTRFQLQDGGQANFTPAAGEGVSMQMSGAGTFDVDTATGDATIDSSGGEVSFQGATGADLQAVGTAASLLTTVNTTTSSAGGTATTDVTAQQTGTGSTSAVINVNPTFTSGTGSATLNLATGGVTGVNVATSGASTITEGSASATSITNDAITGSYGFSTSSDFSIAGTWTGTETLTLSSTTSGVGGTARVGITASGTAATGAGGGSLSLQATSVSASASNLIDVGTTDTVNLSLATFSGPSTITAGSSDTGVTYDLTTGGTSVSSDDLGHVIVFPTKNIFTATELNLDGTTAAAVTQFDSTVTRFQNGNEPAISTYYGLDYTSSSGRDTYTVSVVSCSSSVTASITASTAGVPASADLTFTTTATPSWVTDDLIEVAGMSDPRANGVFQVLAVAATTTTCRGPFTAATANHGYVQRQVPTLSGETGSACRVTVSVMLVDTTGNFFIAEAFDNVASATYQGLGTAATSMQAAYDGGPAIALTNALGSIALTGPVDASVGTGYITIDLPAHTVPTPSTALAITGSANSSGSLVSITDTSTESATALQVTNSGDGPAVGIQNTGSTDALIVNDGVTNHLVVDASGGTTLEPDSGSNVTANVTGSGASLDLNLTSAATYDLTITGGGTYTVSSDGDGQVNLADAIYTYTGSTTQSVTDLAQSTATPAAQIGFTSSVTKFDNGTNGNIAFWHGTEYTSSSGTNTYLSVAVVSCSSSVTATVTATTAGDGTTTNATLTTATTPSWGVGDVILLVGMTEVNANCLFEVLAVAATTTTIRGPLTAATVDHEYMQQNLPTTTGESGTACLATITVQRVTAAGEVEAARFFSNTGSASYVNVITSGGNLADVVDDTGTGSAVYGSTAGPDSFTYGIVQGETITWENSTTNNDLMAYSPAAAGDTVAINNQVSAATTNINAGTGGIVGAALGAIVGGVTSSNDAQNTANDPGASATNSLTATVTSTTVTSPATVSVNAIGTGNAGNVTQVNIGASSSNIGVNTVDVANATTVASNTLNLADGAVLSTVSMGSATGASATTINAGTGNLDVDSAAAITVDAVTGLSLDAGAASNLSTSAGTLTIANTSTTSTDDIAVSATAGDVDVTATLGDITHSSPAGTDSRSAVDVTDTATGAVEVTASTANTGTVCMESDAYLMGNGGDANPAHGIYNYGYTGSSAVSPGIAFVYQGSSSATTTVATGGFVASGGTDAMVFVTSVSGFATNDIIEITNPANPSNKGLFEILTVNAAPTPNEIEVRSLVTTPTTQFVKRNFVADTTVQGTVTKVSVCSLRCGTDGAFEVADFTDSTATYADLVTSATTVTRNTFEDTITGSAIAPGGTVSASSFTGGVIAVKPSSGWSFNTGSSIYLNGLLLANGTSKDVADGTGNNIDIPLTGPRINVGDSMRVDYWQNSTNNTA